MIRRLAPLAAVLLIAACGGSRAQQGSASPSGVTTPSPAPIPTATPTPAPAAATPTPAPPQPPTAVIQAVGMAPPYAFSPASASIRVGTRVTFTNSSVVPHTFTANSGAFDSGQIAPGGSFTFTFSGPGTFPYHCKIHTYMMGTVGVS